MPVLGIHLTETTLTYWATCGWFMVGVTGFQLWKLLGFFKKPKAERTMTVGQCLAAKGQGLVAGFFMSWIWVAGHLWTLLEAMEEELPILEKIPVVAPDQLGSAFIGFVLSWALIPWLVTRFGFKKKA